MDPENIFIHEVVLHQRLCQLATAVTDINPEPGCCFSLATSSATFRLISVELFHSTLSRVVDTTYLGTLFSF